VHFAGIEKKELYFRISLNYDISVHNPKKMFIFEVLLMLTTQKQNKMKTLSITTGTLNNISMFYGDVELYNEGSNEVYEALKEDSEQEMLESPEMWVAMFDFNNKTYAIMGNGAMTSEGDYLVAEIES